MNKYNSLQLCGFRRCPAFAVDGHEFCQVHSPDKVLARANQIVCNEFASALMPPLDDATRALLIKIREYIIRDLDATV